jgi:uncharacterized membrane protein YadS
MSKVRELLQSEDWMSVWLGLFIFLLAMGVPLGIDLLGWAAKPSVWVHLDKAVGPVSKAYGSLGSAGSLALTVVFVIGLMTLAAAALGLEVKRFAVGFGILLLTSVVCLVAGHFGYIAATPDKIHKLGIAWSMKLTGEAGFILALVAGLVIGNFFPAAAHRLKEAARPELFIKTAIVIMGASLGTKAVEAMGLASAVLFRGLAAIIEAYLVYWAVVYFVARRFFGFSREWAAPLASGISICGVSAAIATGGAIRARPIVPIMVSSLVVIFAVVELVVLPFAAQGFLYREPMVAGAWMGLAVKTDGGAMASGAITESLIRARALTELGVAWKEGWILMTTTTVKVFIDVFIGVWAFILAVIWCTAIDRRPGERVSSREIWQRFPKFVLGYVGTFVLMLALCLALPALAPKFNAATEQANVFRQLFFAMTFFGIGVITDFRKLWQEGIGKLAAVYVLCLFGFIIWVGLLISWIFFHGVHPPVVGA